MAMGKARTVTLSLVSYLRSRLDAEGWSNVTIVEAFPEDTKIVTPEAQTGADDEVVIPAMSIYPTSIAPDVPFEIGGATIRVEIPFSIYIYSRTNGQRLDLSEFVKSQLERHRIAWYDYSATGWPPDGTPEQLGMIDIDDVTAQFVDTLGGNEAIRYGTITSFRAVVLSNAA